MNNTFQKILKKESFLERQNLMSVFIIKTIAFVFGYIYLKNMSHIIKHAIALIPYQFKPPWHIMRLNKISNPRKAANTLILIKLINNAYSNITKYDSDSMKHTVIATISGFLYVVIYHLATQPITYHIMNLSVFVGIMTALFSFFTEYTHEHINPKEEIYINRNTYLTAMFVNNLRPEIKEQLYNYKVAINQELEYQLNIQLDNPCFEEAKHYYAKLLQLGINQ